MRPEHYKNREQTYVKHFVLNYYLETVAFHIGFVQPDFVYVDCFSGPWHNNDTNEFADTSIRIALDKLNYVANGLKEQRRRPRMRAIFVEENPTAYSVLTTALERHRGTVDTVALPGTFEENIPKILDIIGKSFGFFFVDPKGWTGFDMDILRPVLNHQPAEVLINFMFDFVNRAVNWSNESNEASFDRCFGMDDWRTVRVLKKREREEHCVQLYQEQLRRTGPFNYVTSTRILKPLQDRAYFHLIYATRNIKGLIKFREVEARASEEQDRVRTTAQEQRRDERSGQGRLGFEDLGAAAFSQGLRRDRDEQYQRAKGMLYDLLEEGAQPYDTLIPHLLRERHITQRILNGLILEGKERGILGVDFKPRQRVPRSGDVVRLIDGNPRMGDPSTS